MDVNQIWQEVLKVALVGSDAQSLVLPFSSPSDRSDVSERPDVSESAKNAASSSPPPVSLENLLAQINPQTPEQHLLRVAGVLALYRQAGFSAPQASRPLPAPCPLTEDQPLCSPLAQHLLANLLAGEHPELLPEWLDRARAVQHRVSPELLPQLLNEGAANASLRSAILSVLGQRGHWLATQRSDWAYALVADRLDLALWQTGSQAERLALLHQIRQQDPPQGRELVISTWKSEKAEVRLAQLQVLATGLSLADEPWLETVLDDRSKPVRQYGASLLARLPDSRLCQRMVARTASLLQFHPTPKPQITVHLPSQWDNSLERDGIIPTPPRHSSQTMGDKAWWLLQMVGMVPPQQWCQQWGASAAVLVQAVEKTWRPTLWQGWAIAASHHLDRAWAEALLEFGFLEFLSLETLPEWARPLVPILSPDRQHQFCLKRLDAFPNPVSALLGTIDLLEQCYGPWSASLTQTFLAKTLQAVGELKSDWASQSRFLPFANRLPKLARFLPTPLTPTVTEQLAQLRTALEPHQIYVTQHFQTFFTRLEICQQLHQAFPTDPPILTDSADRNRK